MSQKKVVYRGQEATKRMVNSGLLFYTNKVVFHPLGLKMVVSKAGEISIEDHQAYPNVCYQSDLYRTGQERFDRYIRECGLKTLQLRRKLLGYDIQKTP